MRQIEEFLTSGKGSPAGVGQHLGTCETCRALEKEILANRAFLTGFAPAARSAGGTSTPIHHDIEFSTPAGNRRHLSAPPVVDGYCIESELGRGGQGVVFKAVQLATKRTVALKVLVGGVFATQRQRGRFDREIELIAGLRHPNIVTLFDSGVTSQGRHYYAMEFVDGVSLNADGRANLHRPVADTLRLFLRICEAVNYAHQRGIIHRDATKTEIKQIEQLLKVTLSPATVNLGTPYLHAGILRSHRGFVIGDQSGGPEIVHIDEALGYHGDE